MRKLLLFGLVAALGVLGNLCSRRSQVVHTTRAMGKDFSASS